VARSAGGGAPATGPLELRDLEEQTPVGSVLLAALMRRQLRLSLGVAAVFATLLGGQPLIAWLWSPYSTMKVFGIPLPWMLLAVVAFPTMVLLGLFYVRRAEAIDEEFSELLGR
jgi:putative solute:sodium symporter small subunit